jgi:hypothetical protein
MAPVRDLGAQYAEAMLKHPYGFALYEPALFDRLKPGSVGYINKKGLWCPILDLTTKDYLNDGYSRFNVPVPEPKSLQRWDPCKAGQVKADEINFKAGVSAASFGFPAEVEGCIEYSTSTEYGAVLLCHDKVAVEGYDNRDRFKQWLKKNAKLLLQKNPEIKDHGICAVMRTYSATDIYITAWDNPEQKVRLGFSVQVPEIGSLGPEKAWSRAHSGAAGRSWAEGEKRVVFFAGVKFSFWGFLGAHEARDQAFRGGEEDEFEMEDVEDGGSCMVHMEDWGKLPGDPDE